MTDWTLLIIAVSAFCAVAGIAFVTGQYYVRADRLLRRLPVVQAAGGDSSSAASAVAGIVARHFDEKRFGVDDTLRGQLRLNPARACRKSTKMQAGQNRAQRAVKMQAGVGQPAHAGNGNRTAAEAAQNRSWAVKNPRAKPESCGI